MPVVCKLYEKKRDKIQKQAVDAILLSLSKTKSALLQMPPGTGKTNVAFEVMRGYVSPEHPILYLTHRTNLKTQTRDRAWSYFPKDFTISEFHGKTRHFKSNIVVGMVPSLANDKGYKKLGKHLRNKTFSLVVVDEAHHTPARQFTKILDMIQLKEIPCLGMTATIRRPDGRPLHPCFGSESVPTFQYTFDQAEKDETIAPVFAHVTLTSTLVTGVPNSKGEYISIRKTVDRKHVINARDNIVIDKVRKEAVRFWNKYGMKPKYVCFCINIEHAKRMVEKFNRISGIRAALYVGDAKEVSKEERELRLKTFKDSDKINMLCCVDLMNEGVDVPSINTLIMCRPTYSNIVYVQQLGRGTRPGKPHILVFDFFDNYANAYGARTAANTPEVSVRPGNIIIDKSYIDNADIIAVDRRVKGIYQNIDAYQNGNRNFYPTVEEALEAGRRLNIKGGTDWRNRYEEDHRLPANPHRFYDCPTFLSQLNNKTPKGHWNNYDAVLREAKKYKTLSEFNRSGVGVVTQRNGWTKKIIAEVFPNSKRMNYWNEKTIEEEFKKYKSNAEVQEKAASAYSIACRLGILKKLLEKYFGYSGKKKHAVKNLDTGEVFKSVMEIHPNLRRYIKKGHRYKGCRYANVYSKPKKGKK